MSVSPLQQAIVRKRVEETISLNPDMAQEVRIQNVEAMASATSQMTMEQLKAFHHQHHAMAAEVAAKQAEQRSMAEQLLQFQNQLNEKQRILDEKLSAQEKTTQSHDKALMHASRAFGDTSRSLQELRSELEMSKRRQSGRWSAFVETVTAKMESASAAANAASSAAAARNPKEDPTLNWQREVPHMGVQQVPEAPIYAGATLRDRRVFMDAYMAYARRLTVLNQGSGLSLRLMPLAACIDPSILPRVCDLEMGRPFESITEEEWRDYFLRGTEVVYCNLEAVDRAMGYLSMKTKIPDGESRVMQLVADFYVKMEEADLPTLYDSEPRKCVQYLVQAIRPPQLKALVERELNYESNRHLKKQWREFVQWLSRHARELSRYENAPVVGSGKAEASKGKDRRSTREGDDKK